MAWHCVRERISRPAGVADGSTDADVGDGKQWTRNVTVRAFRRQLPWRWLLRGLEVLMC